MEQPTGKDLRNFTKDKVLIFLSYIREKGGNEATFPVGEIAHRTDTKRSSIKTLLHRWSQKPFLYRVPHGKVIKRNGFGLVKEVDLARWHIGTRWGYMVTQKGLDYLQYAKIHHPYYGLASDTVTRLSSDRIFWFDPVCHGTFVIRPPFDAQDFGQVKLEELPEGQTHPNDGNAWIFERGGMEGAFLACENSLLRPPSPEFRAYVWTEIERIKKEWLAAHPLFPPTKPSDDVNDVGLPKYHINLANLDAAMKQLEQLRKHPPDTQEQSS